MIAVIGNPKAACLNPSDLPQVFIQGSVGSAVAPVDTWLKGLCALGPCSNDDIGSIAADILTGCASDLQPFFGNKQPSFVQQIYPAVRMGACLAE
jgi:hypothetical protein